MVLNPPPVGSMCNIWDKRVVYNRNRDPIANLYGKSPIWYGFYGFALLLPIAVLYINKHAKWWVLGNMVSGWLRSVEIVNDVRVELGGLRFTQTPVAVASIFLHQIGVWTIYTPQACKHVRGNPGTTWHESVVSSVNKATARTCDLGYFCLDSAKTLKKHTLHTQKMWPEGDPDVLFNSVMQHMMFLRKPTNQTFVPTWSLSTEMRCLWNQIKG